ncbi:hypothetical protein SRHO_G00234060 [Serrasalmus rhombeus]
MPEPLITATPTEQLRERLPVSGLTLLVLALAPCALLVLLLLHCLLLGYKLLRLAQRRKGARSSSESALSGSRSPVSTRRFSCGRATTANCFSSAPELAPPVTSSLASSAERRVRLLRPTGATHAGSWRRGSAPVLLLQSSESEAERGNVVPPNSPEPLAAPSRVTS